MKKYIGGYAILDLTSTTIYADALGALAQDKPVLVYDLPDVYFADTIKATTIDGDDVIIITKGGKTITIANDNTITSTGIVSAPTMENIVDLNGNKRFIEGDINIDVATGWSVKYGKWSLSGTHLMIVLALGFESGTTISASGRVINNSYKIALPDYIYDKIYGLYNNGTAVDRQTFRFFEDEGANVIASRDFAIDKTDSGLTIAIIAGDSITFSVDGTIRVQFDLLIDAE